ncbi:hypothetical protein QBC37DRAFT_152294 [Rhypophila decipiens]|uniref:Uncharacterized protein n=1 Tax=Rhypophila decipiens TaxID=261697 RepID=A0AAN6YIN9_9PEZI|nr:hypothetical protein QBC37DRAFT_152294 [Rhypophila decipiens]
MYPDLLWIFVSCSGIGTQPRKVSFLLVPHDKDNSSLPHTVEKSGVNSRVDPKLNRIDYPLLRPNRALNMCSLAIQSPSVSLRNIFLLPFPYLVIGPKVRLFVYPAQPFVQISSVRQASQTFRINPGTQDQDQIACLYAQRISMKKKKKKDRITSCLFFSRTILVACPVCAYSKPSSSFHHPWRLSNPSPSFFSSLPSFSFHVIIHILVRLLSVSPIFFRCGRQSIRSVGLFHPLPLYRLIAQTKNHL